MILLSFSHSPFVIAASFFFFNDTATTEIYTLSLHDALPISAHHYLARRDLDHLTREAGLNLPRLDAILEVGADRKSTRLNSSHSQISYAVFCLKKKTTQRPRAVVPYLAYVRILHLILAAQ